MPRSECRWSQPEDSELCHFYCPVIITALGPEGSVGEGQVWNNFRQSLVSWGYHGSTEIGQIASALTNARPTDFRSYAQEGTQATYTSDPDVQHQALFHSALDYYTSIGAPPSMTNPSTVVHLKLDLDAINFIRREEGYGPLPLEESVIAPGASAASDQADERDLVHDRELAVSLQAESIAERIFRTRLQAYDAWPLQPQSDSRPPTVIDGDCDEEATEHPYENTCLADSLVGAEGIETEEGSDPDGIPLEKGLENYIRHHTGREVRIIAPKWSQRDTSSLDCFRL